MHWVFSELNFASNISRVLKQGERRKENENFFDIRTRSDSWRINMLVITCFSVDDATKSGFIIPSFQLGTTEYLFYMRSMYSGVGVATQNGTSYRGYPFFLIPEPG